MCIKCIFWAWGIIAVMIFYSNLLSQVPFQVTHETEGVADGAWSPDGNQFAYLVGNTIVGNTINQKLYRIDRDGNNKTLLTSIETWGEGLQ